MEALVQLISGENSVRCFSKLFFLAVYLHQWLPATANENLQLRLSEKLPTFLSLIIPITIFSNLIGALTALFFTNYCVGL